jgi:SAM-dependent methyltransferase
MNNNTPPMNNLEQMTRSFLDEYNSHDAILKYSTKTAGYGINYLVEDVYGPIYDDAIAISRRGSAGPLRILEFGCGAGMNLMALLSRCARKDIPVEIGYGTDFSAALIESARQDSRRLLGPDVRDKVVFHVARNESLGPELAAATHREAEALAGTFDFVFGVNTFRYCNRMGKADECASEIYRLLRPGGTCVMIDMNGRFPAFRSHLWGPPKPPEELYMPSLEDYAQPFERAGFEMLRKEHFCWVPHSAGPMLTAVCRALTPVLNATVRSRAMRSLVVVRKPI